MMFCLWKKGNHIFFFNFLKAFACLKKHGWDTVTSQMMVQLKGKSFCDCKRGKWSKQQNRVIWPPTQGNVERERLSVTYREVSITVNFAATLRLANIGEHLLSYITLDSDIVTFAGLIAPTLANISWASLTRIQFGIFSKHRKCWQDVRQRWVHINDLLNIVYACSRKPLIGKGCRSRQF